MASSGPGSALSTPSPTVCVACGAPASLQLRCGHACCFGCILVSGNVCPSCGELVQGLEGGFPTPGPTASATTATATTATPAPAAQEVCPCCRGVRPLVAFAGCLHRVCAQCAASTGGGSCPLCAFPAPAASSPAFAPPVPALRVPKREPGTDDGDTAAAAAVAAVAKRPRCPEEQGQGQQEQQQQEGRVDIRHCGFGYVPPGASAARSPGEDEQPWPPRTLDGMVALVTGASQGIGAATALALAMRGARVAINYWNSSARAEYLVKHIQNFGGDVCLCLAPAFPFLGSHSRACTSSPPPHRRLRSAQT